MRRIEKVELRMGLQEKKMERKDDKKREGRDIEEKKTDKEERMGN